MNQGEVVRSASQEIERARQNIEDIQAIDKALSLTVTKSKGLLAEAARMDLLFKSTQKRSARL